ncbi:hypothetical protein [uncultured Fusobacterium sp.]|jgi:hypothetical protein|uniref:hypothetical protein n=1 Tax=uncultured Fusobacterium sp. TaxID=159267 RepID=UPI0015A4F44F|nr:hypothetical protein [uncultured Fusobacterium sp.]
MAIQVNIVGTTLKASSFFREDTSESPAFKVDININLRSEKIPENLKEYKGNSKLEIFIKTEENIVEYKGEYIVEYQANDESFLHQHEVDETVVKKALKIIFKQIELVFSSAGFVDFKLPIDNLEKIG